MYCLIDNRNKVAQIVAQQSGTFPVALPMKWVEVAETVKVKCGDDYNADGSFSSPVYAQQPVAVAPSLTQVQTQKLKQLNQSCQDAIYSGFSSSALGDAYIYKSDQISQRNLLFAAQNTSSMLLVCAPSATPQAFARVLHTQAQAQKVSSDFVSFSNAQRSNLTTLETQVAAATTIAAVQAITWKEVNGG